MKRPLAWTAGILAVAALIGGIAWLLHVDRSTGRTVTYTKMP